jgi:hypothetical protein
MCYDVSREFCVVPWSYQRASISSIFLSFEHCVMMFPESFALYHAPNTAPHSLRIRVLMSLVYCMVAFSKSFALCHGLSSAPRSVWQGYRRMILFKEDFEKKQPSFEKATQVNNELWCFERVLLRAMVLIPRLAQFGRATVE